MDCRGSQINYWLSQHPEIKDFAILDDINDHFKENFFKVNSSKLLTREICEEILSKVEAFTSKAIDK